MHISTSFGSPQRLIHRIRMGRTYIGSSAEELSEREREDVVGEREKDDTHVIGISGRSLFKRHCVLIRKGKEEREKEEREREINKNNSPDKVSEREKEREREREKEKEREREREDETTVYVEPYCPQDFARTLLNGQLMLRRTSLSHGDILTIGMDNVFRFGSGRPSDEETTDTELSFSSLSPAQGMYSTPQRRGGRERERGGGRESIDYESGVERERNRNLLLSPSSFHTPTHTPSSSHRGRSNSASDRSTSSNQIQACRSLDDVKNAFQQAAASVEQGDRENTEELLSRALSLLSDDVRSIDLSLHGLGGLVGDTDVESLSLSCPSLEHLDLSSCFHVTDRSLESVADNCNQLRSLKLSRAREVTDESILSIATKCSQLENVSFRSCWSLSDLSLSQLVRQCKNIQYLELHNCPKITDTTLHALANHCQQLLSLSLAYSESITDESLTNVGVLCKSLSSLSLKSIPNVSDIGLSRILQNGSLSELHLDAVRLITNKTILSLSQNCSQLESLSLLSLSPDLVDDTALCSLFPHAEKLKRLQLEGSHLITTNAILSVSESCKKLRHIELMDCDSVTDDTVKALCKRKKLKTLKLWSCGNVTDLSLRLLPIKLQRLQALSLSGCPGLSPERLSMMAAVFPQLTELTVSDCEPVTETFKVSLRSQFPHLSLV